MYGSMCQTALKNLEACGLDTNLLWDWLGITRPSMVLHINRRSFELMDQRLDLVESHINNAHSAQNMARRQKTLHLRLRGGGQAEA